MGYAEIIFDWTTCDTCDQKMPRSAARTILLTPGDGDLMPDSILICRRCAGKGRRP